MFFFNLTAIEYRFSVNTLELEFLPCTFKFGFDKRFLEGLRCPLCSVKQFFKDRYLCIEYVLFLKCIHTRLPSLNKILAP